MLDIDYWKKLDPQSSEWLERFCREFYLTEFGETPIHSPEQITELYRANNSSIYDLVTATGESVTTQLTTQSRSSKLNMYYNPDDYAMFRSFTWAEHRLYESDRRTQSPEDAILDLIDKQKEEKILDESRTNSDLDSAISDGVPLARPKKKRRRKKSRRKELTNE